MAINLGPGPQDFPGTDGPDRINGNGGNDTIRGRGGDDRISGNRGNDNLFGNGGDDDLFGNQGRDHLDGGFGNDELFGGGGRDRLDGGNGVGNNQSDSLTGGGGADLFVYDTQGGDDVILDFDPSENDLIQIENLTTAQLNNLAADTRNRNVIEQGDFRAFLDSAIQDGNPPPGGSDFVFFNFDGDNSLTVFGVNRLDPAAISSVKTQEMIIRPAGHSPRRLFSLRGAPLIAPHFLL